MATKKVATATQARVLVRTLIGGEWVEANSVIDVTPELLAAHPGELDADPDAVAYAKSLSE